MDSRCRKTKNVTELRRKLETIFENTQSKSKPQRKSQRTKLAKNNNVTRSNGNPKKEHEPPLATDRVNGYKKNVAAVPELKRKQPQKHRVDNNAKATSGTKETKPTQRKVTIVTPPLAADRVNGYKKKAAAAPKLERKQPQKRPVENDVKATSERKKIKITTLASAFPKVVPTRNSSSEDSSFDFSSEEEDDSYSSEDYYSDFEYEGGEEEDDSYYSDNTSSYEFDSSDIMDDDEDYRLPAGVAEDLIIHQGTATRRPMVDADNINFDSDNGEMQIIELTEENEVRAVQQPSVYAREVLSQLCESFVNITPRPLLNSGETDTQCSSSASDCPQLVLDEERFDSDSDGDLESDGDDETVSLGSSYEECSSSINSEDINDKYIQGQSSDDNEEMNHAMKAHVIRAVQTEIEVQPPTHTSLYSSANAEELPAKAISFVADCAEAQVITAAVLEEQRQPFELENNYASHFVKAISVPALLVSAPEVASPASPPLLSRFYNAADSNRVLVWLQDAFHIYGTVRLTLIAGSVDIYGHSPVVDTELEIFSPRGCAAVEIAPRPTAQSTVKKEQLHQALRRLSYYFTHHELQEISERFSDADALLMLRRNTERKHCLAFMRIYMNENVFPNINGMHLERPLYATEHLLHCLISRESEKGLRVPPQWAQLPFGATSRMLLVGGKAVGKSTLLRFLINRHLAERPGVGVLLIDLDIGQPELFVPQSISCSVVAEPLLGPGFLQNRQPAKAYMIGHCNVLLCAHAYMRAVRKLIAHCHATDAYDQLPWVINTMGYNKGFGMELIALVRELLLPTDIVQLQSNRDINNFDALLQPKILAAVPRCIFVGDEFARTVEEPPQFRLHVLHTAVPQESRYRKEWVMSAKDLRYAMLLARLSDALQQNAEWLTDCKPLSASLDQIRMLNMCAAEETHDELIKAVEANLVYLCRTKGTDCAPPECLGIGVVRAIDYHVQQIFLLPAMPYDRMSSVNCLALGETPLPTSLFTNQGPLVKDVAPFVYNAVDASASKSIKQIYHRPSEFLTGRHKTVL